MDINDIRLKNNEKINELKEKYDFAEIIPISAKKKNNLDSLISCLKKYLPDMDKIYSDEDLTNVSTRFIMAEFVREKVLELTREEIPHSVTCYVENYEEDEEEELRTSKIASRARRENIDDRLAKYKKKMNEEKQSKGFLGFFKDRLIP